MKKNKSPLASVVFLVIVLAWLWDACEDTIEYLFIRTPPSVMKFRTLWARDPQRLIAVGVFLLVCIILVITFFSMLGKKAAGPARSSTSASSRSRDTRTRKDPTRNKFTEKLEADEAIHCAHRNGREKYLEQIDNYLKTGLIDRNEYRVLRDRYMKIDIPDDYH